MYSGILVRIGQKQLGCFSKGQVGFFHDEKIEAEFPEFRRHDQGGSLASGNLMTIARTNQEAQLPGGRAFQGLYAADTQVGSPLTSASRRGLSSPSEKDLFPS